MIKTTAGKRKIIPFIGLVIVTGLFFSCRTVPEIEKNHLKSLARDINLIFFQSREQIESLKEDYTALLQREDPAAGLYPDTRYAYSKDYVYYTPFDDGKCEVWASGRIPIGKTERKRIKMLENLCPQLQNVYQKNDCIATAYVTTFDSIVMAYPYADIHAYMEHGLDLTQAWVTYRAAARQENPTQRTLWVPPYLDAVGKGYMTSVITPVYSDDVLEATLGIDITVDTIVRRFQALSEKNRFISTIRTVPVCVNKNSAAILRIKGLEKYNYLQKVPENKSIPPEWMMSENPRQDIRKIAQWLRSDSPEIVLPVSGRKYRFYKVYIPEVEWFLIEFIKD